MVNKKGEIIFLQRFSNF